MIKSIIELLKLLSHSQRRKLIFLQILVTTMAFAEVVSIASIAPFMALVGNSNILITNSFLSYIYVISDLNDPYDFIFLSGITVLLLLTFSSLLSMFTTYYLGMFGSHTGTSFANRLYNYYMSQSWLFHTKNSSSKLTKNITNETTRLTDYIIQPLMQINAKIVLSIAISISLLLYNPLITLSGLAIFAIAYCIIYSFFKKILKSNSSDISKISTERFRLMSEGFGGIKEILLIGKSSYFKQSFEKAGNTLARAQGLNFAISYTPRYFIELIAFGSMIIFVLYLIKAYEGDIGEILPIVAIYSLAGFKLLPALQQIYWGVAQIKGSISALETIRDDLKQSQLSAQDTPLQKTNPYRLTECIELDNICFSYPDTYTQTLSDINFKIPANKTFGIIGRSGMGKSTLLDILLGLLNPEKGRVLIDGKVLSDANRRAWQNCIAFVPQQSFLSEGTISQNVAFGTPQNQIDEIKVKLALKMAHLLNHVQELPDGIHTEVGERGVKLSGGQKQRIGIARALYSNAQVLIFDEATSALDEETEKIIMDTINDLNGQKTIILVSHRPKILEKCDFIFDLNINRFEAVIESTS